MSAQASANDKGTESLVEGTGAQRPSVQPTAAGPGLLALQRTVGNAAVSRLVAAQAADNPAQTADNPAVPVQRLTNPEVPVQRLTVTASDLDQAMGSSKRGLFGAGASSYAKIRSVVAEYQKAKSSGKPVFVVLEKIETLSTAYLNAHRGESGARRDMVEKLQEEAARERLGMGQKWSEDVYLNSMSAGAKTSRGDADPVAADYAHTMQATTQAGRIGAADARDKFASQYAMTSILLPDEAPKVKAKQDLASSKGLTPAEVAAIVAYSGPDYKFINAAASNSPGWMESVKNDPKNKTLTNDRTPWSDISTKDLMEEGSLHAAVARKGLRKLDTVTTPVYRGQNFTPAEFANLRASGKYTFLYLVSTSTNRGVSVGYAGTSDERPIGVMWLITNHGGKDITLLSQNPGEDEVMLLPGTEVTIRSIVEIPSRDQISPWAARGAGAHLDDLKALHQSRMAGSWKSASAVYMIIAEGKG